MVSAYHAASVYFYAADEVCVRCRAATDNANANMKADGGVWDCGSDHFVFDHIHHLYRLKNNYWHFDCRMNLHSDLLIAIKGQVNSLPVYSTDTFIKLYNPQGSVYNVILWR